MSALRLYFPFTCFSSHMRSTQRLNLITLRHQKSQDRVHACVKLREFPQTYARSQELLNKTSGTFQGKFKGSLWHPHSANPRSLRSRFSTRPSLCLFLILMSLLSALSFGAFAASGGN
jgi:hypothetical protein